MHAGMEPSTSKPLNAQAWPWAPARGNMLQPGSACTQRFFARHPMVLQVGSTVFVHAGLHPEHVQNGLDALNDEVQVWLPVYKIAKRF